MDKQLNITNLFDLQGKIAFITGGSSGIGYSLGKALALAGATIVFNGQSQTKIENAIEAYKNIGIIAHGYVCNVRDEQDVIETVKKINNEVGVIDILVNNAAIIKRIPMLEISSSEFREVIDVDLCGPFIVSKVVIPGMMKKGGGKIINICSMMSELGRESVSAYASAKGGLKMLTKNIASEYGQYNIQCNGLGPGYIATHQTEPLRANGHPFNSFILAKTPAARWGTPEDLEGPTLFLASAASNFVNGHILYVDGGILAYIGRQPTT
jgi:gluconate 5-dehydrogenase